MFIMSNAVNGLSFNFQQSHGFQYTKFKHEYFKTFI